MIQLPRLLDANLAELARLHPVSLAVDLQMRSISTATLVVPENERVMAGQYMELFNAHGSMGIFRVQRVEQDTGGVQSIGLEHGIISMSDDIIPLVVKSQKAPAPEVLQTIMDHQTMWQLGGHDFTNEDLLTWSCDFSNVYESLVNLLEEFPDRLITFDQTTTPWTLTIARATDEDASECRLTRNMTSLLIETDRTDLCTRLYIPQGKKDPIVLDADTQNTWGIVSRRFEGDSKIATEDKIKLGEKYLREHKDPKMVVSIDAIDLSAATGESLDAFNVGKICRVCLPDYEQTIKQRIVAVSYPDVYGDPDHVTITMADEAETASAEIAGLVVETTVVKKFVENYEVGEWKKQYFLTSQPVVSAKHRSVQIGDVKLDYIESVDVTIQGAELDYMGRTALTEEEL